jgi:hypothetical protein
MAIRYKMVGRDINSLPIQYRTWMVNNTPDFDQEHYYGNKSGSNPLVDVTAYSIYDDSLIVDFNLPLVTSWEPTFHTLPQEISYSHLAIINDFIYLFGGNFTNKILRASVNNPVQFEDTGYTLPISIYGGQLAVINDNIYIFGGNDGKPCKKILSSSINNPLLWVNHGDLLPESLCSSQLAIIDGYIYLYGGMEHFSHATNKIFKSSVINPLNWEILDNTLPYELYNSQLGIVGDYIYLYGGQDLLGQPVDNILRAPISKPSEWIDYSYLPYAICSGQFFTIGNEGYLITSISPGRQEIPSYININNGEARILQCSLSTPASWFDTQYTVPGEINFAQLGIIYDRAFIYGGSGSSNIYASNFEIKYDFNSFPAVNYANVTRTQYSETLSALDLFKVLGFPPWKADYGRLL